MTSGRFRRTGTRTFVLEQPAERVFQALVDPQVARWMVSKCVHTVAAPGSADTVGALRCCWLDRVRRGVRQVAVLELVTAEQDGHVRYVDRSVANGDSPNGSYDFQLTVEANATRVQVTGSSRHLAALEDGLRAAAAGEPSGPTNPQIVTLAVGAGAKRQVHEIVIAAAPKRVWGVVDAKDALPADLERVASWKSSVDGVEFRYTIFRRPDELLDCNVTRVISAGPFRLTTVDSVGMEIGYELLPHEDACLLRMTYSWTIPIRSKGVRRSARSWQDEAKAAAESS